MNKRIIANPPILAVGFSWKAWGFKKSSSNREPEKKKFRVFSY